MQILCIYTALPTFRYTGEDEEEYYSLQLSISNIMRRVNLNLCDK